jgi:exopolysaccharide production protein ExoQ
MSQSALPAAPAVIPGSGVARLTEARAVTMVALTALIMAYSWRFKVVPILVFFALWFPLIRYKGRFTLTPSRGLILTLLLPLVACYSCLWSDYRWLSLYLGLEFVAMALCTAIIVRTVAIDALIKGIALGALLVLALTLINGSTARDYFSGTQSLVGLLRSKNQVGLFAEIAIFAGLLAFLSARGLSAKLVFSLVPLAVGFVGLVLCRSAASQLSLAAMLAAVGVTAFLGSVRGPKRLFALLLTVIAVLAVVVFVVAFDIDVRAHVLETVGKSQTLTGRTYLWAEGIKAGLERPELGRGYSAFWVPGQPLAEKYWREFLITNQTGFHFHSMFIQTFVDLGILGLAIVGLLLLFGLARGWLLILRYGATLPTVFALGMVCMLSIRSYVEVDWLGPFGIGPLLLFAAILTLADPITSGVPLGRGHRVLQLTHWRHSHDPLPR